MYLECALLLRPEFVLYLEMNESSVLRWSTDSIYSRTVYVYTVAFLDQFCNGKLDSETIQTIIIVSAQNWHSLMHVL